METVQLLGNIGEFLGSIGVFATLLYLAVQIRESRKAATFTAVQANRAERVANFRSVRDSPFIAPILAKVQSGEVLSPEESNRLFNHDAATWALLYAEWVQRELGLMGEFATRDELALAVVFGSSSAREWWRLAGRNIYPARFVESIEAAMAEFDRSSKAGEIEPALLRMISGR
jgi:hypothetical protein